MKGVQTAVGAGMVVCVLLAAACVGAGEAAVGDRAARHGFTVAGGDVEGSTEATVTLLLHPSAAGLAEVKAFVAEASTPGSPGYGGALTRKELLAALAPPPHVVDGWVDALVRAGFHPSAISVSYYRDSIVARGTVAAAQALAGVPYARLVRPHPLGQAPPLVLHRPLDAPVWPGVAPDVLAALAFAVGVEDVAIGSSDVRVRSSQQQLGAAAAITPAVAQKRYGTANATVGADNSNNTVAVAEFSGQFFSADDLATFESAFGLAPQAVAKIVGTDAGPAGTEAELDVQWVVGMTAPAAGSGVNGTTPTWFVYTETGRTFAELIAAWSTALAAADDVPLVNSVSYGLGNSDTPDALKTRIDAEFVKLAARRVSVIFSSGDHGSSCNLFPIPHEDVQYPASSPHVLSVGATYLDSSSSAEVAATLSGGGFGHVEDAPTWQTAAVKAYLASGVPLPPKFEYDSSKRAIPDVAAFGENVIIVVGGSQTSVAGTSCSAPMVASIFAAINGHLAAAGKPPLGFLPPFVYANPHAFTDIVSGDNRDGLCHGWEARPGWDAVSGLGSPVFSKLLAAALAL